MNDNVPLDALDPRASAILEFWFGTSLDDSVVAEQKSALWWGHAPETDALISEKFLSLIEAAGRGELHDWTPRPRGRLAVILLLDQFTRNVYRGTARMYERDANALHLTLEGIEQGLVSALRPIEQVFFLLPLEHSEDLEHQRLMLHLAETIRDGVKVEWRDLLDSYCGYARSHMEVIERFGRFPHRNAILGRSSSGEEVEFLKQPGSSF